MKLEDNISAPLEDANTPIGKDVLAKHRLDRIAGEKLKLPYSYDDIKLNPNAHVTYKSFNESITRLYENMVYIDAHSKMLPNNFPETQTRWFGQINPGTAKLEYLNSPFQQSPLYVPDAAVSTIINNITSATFITRDKKQYGIIGNGNRLVIIRYNADSLLSAKVLHNSDGIDSGPRGDSIDYNYFAFQHISNVIAHENVLYVCDSGLKKIFKYDISGLFSNNPATEKRGKVLLKQIGGTGTNADKVKFNTCQTIKRSAQGKIYVLDYSPGKNATIKVLDKDLNWEKTHKKEATFRNNPPVDFDIDPQTGKVYILSSVGTIIEISADFKVDTVHSNIHIPKPGETYINLFMSSISNDVLYVSTTKEVLKKFKTHLSKTIGTFRTGASHNTDIIGSDETIKFASASNVRASLINEEVYVAVKRSKTSPEVYSIPRKPVLWGLNHKGQLNIPAEIINDELEPYSMHAGFNSTFAVVPPGKLIGWGDNGSNQVSDIPLKLKWGDTGILRVEDLGVGLKHCIAVTNSGILTAWGDNRYGQIAVPKELQDGTVTVVACDAGEFHSAAVDSTGKVYMWGLNDNGQCTGTATTDSTSQYGRYHHSGVEDEVASELPFTGLGTVSASDVVCGYSHNFIINKADDDKVIGWGSNYYKQTDWATASATVAVAPKYINVPNTSQVLSATQIDGGYGHTVALTGNWPNTGLVAWGLNNYGQINGVHSDAMDDQLAYTTALEISGHTLSGLSAIAVGGFHNVAVYTTQTYGAAVSATVDDYVTDIENQLLTWGSGSYLQTSIPYNLYKTGIDLSRVFSVDMYGDDTPSDTVPTASVALYESLSSDQIGTYFSVVSNVDVKKVDAGFGHSAVVSRAMPSHNNPTYIYEFGIANLYKTIIYDNYRKSCYSIDQLELNEKEFVSSWVINKCLTKMVYNHVVLYNNFHSNFTFVRDVSGNPVYRDTQFIAYTPKTFKDLSFDVPNDFFTGTNEIIVTETFNRPLKGIYDMQRDLVSLCDERYVDVFPPHNKTLNISTGEYI